MPHEGAGSCSLANRQAQWAELQGPCLVKIEATLPSTRGDGVFWLDVEVSNARTDPQPLAGLSLVAPTMKVEYYLAPFHPDDFEGPPSTGVMAVGEPDVRVIKAPAEPSASERSSTWHLHTRGSRHHASAASPANASAA